MNEYIGIGAFIKPHGLRGELLLIPYNSDTVTFSSDIPLFIQEGRSYEKLAVEKVRPVNKGFLLKLEGFNSIESVLSFKKRQVFVKKTDIVLDENEYLISDLVNLDCYNEKDENIGVITDIYSGNTDIAEIKSDDKTYLIPMLDENIISIDCASKRIIVKNEEYYTF